jgi:catechol 2,3-dioxygenase-like lactoylglutathione lyase family enzyme
MFAHIKHAAIYTQNPQNAIAFYERILGMKRITTAVTENNRGHISDGLIGLAVLARRPGIPAGLDHFGFEVDDVDGDGCRGDARDLLIPVEDYPNAIGLRGIAEDGRALLPSGKVICSRMIIWIFVRDNLPIRRFRK